jgi:hypothetical protein
MSAISTIGARIAQLDKLRPARRGHTRLIRTLKHEKSSQYLCLEASITFISRPHDVLDQILAPYSLFDAELRFDLAVRALMSAVLGIPRAKESTAAEELPFQGQPGNRTGVPQGTPVPISELNQRA